VLKQVLDVIGRKGYHVSMVVKPGGSILLSSQVAGVLHSPSLPEILRPARPVVLVILAIRLSNGLVRLSPVSEGWASRHARSAERT
jgi:hypothetical protein